MRIARHVARSVSVDRVARDDIAGAALVKLAEKRPADIDQAWVIARSAAIDERRRVDRWKNASALDDDTAHEPLRGIEGALDIAAAVLVLSPYQLEVLQLRASGYTLDEIAQRYGVSVRTASGFVSDSAGILRELLSQIVFIGESNLSTTRRVENE